MGENQEQPAFRLGDFEGPLDLLLHLIGKSEINIYDIPIARITEQYLQFLSYATRVDLDNISDFYVMAATLLLIKSRMLLPQEMEMEDEYEDPRQELVERLLEYQRFKRISELMAERAREGEWRIERGQKVLPFPDEGMWEEASIWDLLTTFSTILSSISNERIMDLHEEVSVSEKKALMLEILEEREECLLTEVLSDSRSVMELVCAFMAILELAKARLVSIYQNRLFGEIRLRRPRRATA